MREGQKASVQCTAPHLCSWERPKITWKGANVTTVHPRWTMRFTQPGSTIHISPKAEDHNTNLTCQLHYSDAMVESTVTLEVQCKCPASHQAHHFPVQCSLSFFFFFQIRLKSYILHTVNLKKGISFACVQLKGIPCH